MGLARAALVCLALLAPAFGNAAEPISVSSQTITRFKGANPGERVDGLIWRGGLQMGADHRQFGGISGLTFLDTDRFVMVSDEGWFISGRLELADGQPRNLIDVELEPIRNSSGNILPNRFSADAEAVTAIFRNGQPVAVRVGFENLTRVADFDLTDGRPGGAARPVTIPEWLSQLRTNESIESVCIAPPASPVAGSTLIITEAHSRQPGTWAATLLGVRDRGDLHLARSGAFNPTACAFLPNGDLLVLERGLFMLSFSTQIRRIPADHVQPGAVMDGEVILSASGRDVDNMEAMDVRTLSNGEVRITLVSDDNFNSFQRNLLLEFALP